MLGRREIGHQLARIGKARGRPVRRPCCRMAEGMPRIVCNAGHRLGMSSRATSLRSAPSARSRRRGGFDCLNVILEHEVVCCLLKTQTSQPAAMQLGPGRTSIMATLAQQEPRKLLGGARRNACTASRRARTSRGMTLVSDIGNPHRGQLAGAMGPAVGGVPVDRSLHFGINDGATTTHSCLCPDS